VADGGTIYLDEIGDMKPGLQAKLLRFIENKVIRRVGGHRDISVDVRVQAATNRVLDDLVRTGQFREDLFFRLNVIPIFIPPLRDRREDILPLAEHFLAMFSNDIRRPGSGFSDIAKRQMRSYGWPGNVRELRNIIERALILGAAGIVEVLDLPLADNGEEDGSASVGGAPFRQSPDGRSPRAPGVNSPGAAPPGETDEVGTAAESGDGRFPAAAPGGYAFLLPPSGVVLENVEQDFLRQALEATQGNQTKAAEMLGLTRDALRYRMKKFGLL
jgi:two-component system response regulator AtoC